MLAAGKSRAVEKLTSVYIIRNRLAGDFGKKGGFWWFVVLAIPRVGNDTIQVRFGVSWLTVAKKTEQGENPELGGGGNRRGETCRNLFLNFNFCRCVGGIGGGDGGKKDARNLTVTGGRVQQGGTSRFCEAVGHLKSVDEQVVGSGLFLRLAPAATRRRGGG